MTAQVLFKEEEEEEEKRVLGCGCN